MESIYLTCLVIGLILLVIDVFSNGISDIFSAGFFSNLSSDGLSGLLPFSLLDLIAFTVGFGGMGLVFISLTPLHFLIAILLGILLASAVHFLIKALKNAESSALKSEELIGSVGTVIVTIFNGSVGSVSFDTQVGKITYSAKSNKTISQGKKVRVIAIENHTMIVREEDDDLFTF